MLWLSSAAGVISPSSTALASIRSETSAAAHLAAAPTASETISEGWALAWPPSCLMHSESYHHVLRPHKQGMTSTTTACIKAQDLCLALCIAVCVATTSQTLEASEQTLPRPALAKLVCSCTRERERGGVHSPPRLLKGRATITLLQQVPVAADGVRTCPNTPARMHVQIRDPTTLSVLHSTRPL